MVVDPINPNSLGIITITADKGAPTSANNSGLASTGGFCGNESRISTNICNSLHPAIAFDPFGNPGITWHDTRDGNFEIYFRVLQGFLTKEQLNLFSGFAFDPATGKAFNTSCSGFSSTSSGASNALVTQSGGRLDVNASSQVMVLTAAVGSVDFTTLGVTPNDTITILNGLNSGQQFFVLRILAPTVVELLFVDSAKSDTSFVYTVTKSQNGLSSAEIRLTCNKGASQFPDIVADSMGRYHIVFQDDSSGHYELYYTQIYPDTVGPDNCSGDPGSLGLAAGGSASTGSTGTNTSGSSTGTTSLLPINVSGLFLPVTSGTPGTITLILNPVSTPTGFIVGPNTVIVAYAPTGQTGQFFSYGDKLLADPFPTPNQTGLHRLFSQNGQYIGVSKASDRQLWNSQIQALGLTVTPDYIAPPSHPVFGLNDFGTKLGFSNVAFVAQTPPDKSVEITRIELPLKPKCIPQQPSKPLNPSTDGLVSAPKTPVPPGFVDPISLSDILNSPLAQIDQSVPPRFTIEGDSTGTIFTNVLMDNGRGELTRFVFSCDETNKKSDTPRFILGQRLCGTELCALIPPLTTPDPTTTPTPSSQYKLRLQVWEGPDYRLVPKQEQSAQFKNCELLVDKTFSFNAGENIQTFNFRRGELTVPDGRFLFFVPIPTDTVDFFIDGAGKGHEIWSTSGDGAFDQYYVPFTVPPNAGLDAPVYYEGFLKDATKGLIIEPSGFILPKPDASCPIPTNFSINNGYNPLPIDSIAIDRNVAGPTPPHTDNRGNTLIVGGPLVGTTPLDTLSTPDTTTVYGIVPTAEWFTPAGGGLKVRATIPAPVIGDADNVIFFDDSSNVVVQKFTNPTTRTLKWVKIGSGGFISNGFPIYADHEIQHFGAPIGDVTTASPGTISLQNIEPGPASVTTVDIINDSDYTAAITGQPYTPVLTTSTVCTEAGAGRGAMLFCATLPAGNYAFVLKGISSIETWLHNDTAPANVGVSSLPDFPQIDFPQIVYPATEVLDSHGNVQTYFPPKVIQHAFSVPSRKQSVRFVMDFSDSAPPPPVTRIPVPPIISGQTDLLPIDFLRETFTTPDLWTNQNINMGVTIKYGAAANVRTIKVNWTPNTGNDANPTTIYISDVRADATGNLIPDSSKIYFSAPLSTPIDTSLLTTSDAVQAGDVIDTVSVVHVDVNVPQNFAVYFTNASGVVSYIGGSNIDIPTNAQSVLGQYGIVSAERTVSSNVWNSIPVTKSTGVVPQIRVDLAQSNGTPTVIGSENDIVTPIQSGSGRKVIVSGSGGGASTLLVAPPVQITKSSGNSVHPRLTIDESDRIWLTYFSDRTGADEVFVNQYFCGKWNSSANGGSDLQLTRASDNGKIAKFPDIVADDRAEVHVVYESTNTSDGSSQIFYSKTLSSTEFTKAKQISASKGETHMPTVAVSSNSKGEGLLTVAWHDNRFGNYEIMAAQQANGNWRSSGQGTVDIRVTQASGDSVFPRMSADQQGNVRIVYHDYRRGDALPWIYMSTFVGSKDRWDSSGQGGSDIAVSVGNQTAQSLHPDIDIDVAGGAYVVWHDTRFETEENVKEEIIGSYCPKTAVSSAFCGPILANVEAFVQTSLDIIDNKGNPIDITNTPNIGLSIDSPGATFVRVSQDGGSYSDWLPFKPGPTLDGMILPWKLIGGSGEKTICVQVQDATTIGFPVCKSVFLRGGLPVFKVDFFKDFNLTLPFDSFHGRPAIPDGDVFVKLTSSIPLVAPPTFDVIGRGTRLILNQSTLPIQSSGVSGFSGTSSSGTSSGTSGFSGVSGTSGILFSAFVGSEFKARFHVFRDDAFYYVDGPARLIPHGKDINGNVF